MLGGRCSDCHVLIVLQFRNQCSLRNIREKILNFSKFLPMTLFLPSDLIENGIKRSKNAPWHKGCNSFIVQRVSYKLHKWKDWRACLRKTQILVCTLEIEKYQKCFQNWHIDFNSLCILCWSKKTTTTK